MKKIISILFASTILLTACNDEHSHYVNGVVITEQRSMTGIYVQVDTTYDGVADIEAQVLGTDMYRKYSKGDSMSVDVWGHRLYASPIVHK